MIGSWALTLVREPVFSPPHLETTNNMATNAQAYRKFLGSEEVCGGRMQTKEAEAIAFEVRPKDRDGWFIARCEYEGDTFYCQGRSYEQLRSDCLKLTKELCTTAPAVTWNFNDSYTIHPQNDAGYGKYV